MTTMARMKTLSLIIEELESLFPEGQVSIGFDSGKYDELVITIRTGLVEPADGQQLHTVDEIIEVLEDET